MDDCSKCRFYFDFGDDKFGLPTNRGECKRRSPIGNWPNEFPKVDADAWCGEFEERKDEE